MRSRISVRNWISVSSSSGHSTSDAIGSSAIDTEFVGYDVTAAANEIIVRRNGRGIGG